MTPFWLRRIDSCQNFMVIFSLNKVSMRTSEFLNHIFRRSKYTIIYLFRGASNNATVQMYGKFEGFPINSSVSQGLQLSHSRSFAHNLRMAIT